MLRSFWEVGVHLGAAEEVGVLIRDCDLILEALLWNYDSIEEFCIIYCANVMANIHEIM